MIRDDYETLDVAEWTPEEAAHHLGGTFDRCARIWPDILAPYVTMLADAPPGSEVEIMRNALRDTIRQRYPLRGFEEGDRANGAA